MFVPGEAIVTMHLFVGPQLGVNQSEKLRECLDVEAPWTWVIEDPSGSSEFWVQPLDAASARYCLIHMVISRSARLGWMR